MTSQAKNTFDIVQGPDRLAILMAFTQYGKHARRVPADAVLGSHEIVFFVSKYVKLKQYADDRHRQHTLHEVKFYITITGVQHADISGRCWNIEGLLMTATPQPASLDYDSLEPALRVHIRYNTDTKDGVLKVLRK